MNKEKSGFKPNKSKSFGMYINTSWYSIELKKELHKNLLHLNNLDINLLHHHLLEPKLFKKNKKLMDAHKKTKTKYLNISSTSKWSEISKEIETL